MSAPNSELLREGIRTVLARRAGKSPDARAVAAASLHIWRQVSARLAAVIGVRGVDALFSHSLHVTSKDFPWLALSNDGNSTALLASLEACLAGREATVAAAASHALLVNFTELLATLIGTSLTERLLAPVWLPGSPESEQERAP